MMQEMKKTQTQIKNVEKIDILIPENDAQRRFINAVAHFVVRVGHAMELRVLEDVKEGRIRCSKNITLDFLRAPHTSPDGLYYLWRVYSLLQGDTRHRWRTEPFQIVKDGRVFRPPKIPDYRPSRSRSRNSHRRGDDRRRDVKQVLFFLTDSI